MNSSRSLEVELELQKNFTPGHVSCSILLTFRFSSEFLFTVAS